MTWAEDKEREQRRLDGDDLVEPPSLNEGLPACSWCIEQAIQWLMGQPFCKYCGTRFCKLHPLPDSKDKR